ncbi:MAG: phosphatidylglycerol lysyltransferase domain-containing protein, partial [Myxococcota bacterium]
MTRAVPYVGVALVALAVWAVHRELGHLRWRDVSATLAAVPAWRWLAAAGLTATSYAALAGSEWVAVRHVGVALPARRVLLAGALGWAVTNTVGQAWLSGAAVRMRLYSGWGVGAGDVGRIVAVDTLGFGLGYALTAGLALTIDPPPQLDPWGRLAGIGLLAVVALALAAASTRREPVRIGPFTLTVPGVGTLGAQLALSVVDHLAAIGALYVLLPVGPGGAAVGFAEVVSLFLAALFVGIVSGVPGGVGTLDGALVLLAAPYVDGVVVIGAVLAWRVVYDLLPLAITAVVLAGFELRRLRASKVGEPLEQMGGLAGRFARSLAPPALAGLAFAGGLVLLGSSLRPADVDRLGWLSRVLPLAVVETSHAVSAMVGVGLLFVARGLWTRLRAAWTTLLALCVAGGVLALLRGLDWEEAVLLGGVVAVALPARPEFYRQSALGREALTAPWAAAVVGSVAVAGFVLLHAYGHVRWEDTSFFTFAAKAEASRSLRAFGLAAAMAGAAVLGSWLRPVRRPAPVPSDADVADAVRIAATHAVSNGRLCALRDKALLFDDDRTAFLMYGVAHGVWVCYAGPIGPPDRCADLLWTFRELADEAGARIALYEIRAELLPTCIDLGLRAYKFGEEAIVPITGFSLEGSAHKNRRNLL